MKWFSVKLPAKEDNGSSDNHLWNVADELCPCTKIQRVELPATSSDSPTKRQKDVRSHTDKSHIIDEGRSKAVDKFSCLEYSVEQYAVLCFVCRHFAVKDNVCEDVLLHEYSYRKHIGNMATKQENSKVRKLSLAKYQGRYSDGCVEEAAESEYFNNIGNFQEFSNLFCLETKYFSSKLSNMPQNAKYASNIIQNDMLQAELSLIMQDIIREIKSGTRDAGFTEQMSICLRHLHNSEIKERFLSFVELDHLNAHTLANTIIYFLTLQSFDGASVTSGALNGVQVLIRHVTNNPCSYVHCHAHILNLVGVTTAAGAIAGGWSRQQLELHCREQWQQRQNELHWRAVATATERAALESSGSGNRTSCTGEQWQQKQNELHCRAVAAATERWQQKQNELHWRAVAAATERATLGTVAAATERAALGAVTAATERAELERSGSSDITCCTGSSGISDITCCTGSSGSSNRTSFTGEQWQRQPNELHWEQWQQRQNELHWRAVAAATEHAALGVVAAATERAALERSGISNSTSCTGEQWQQQQNELHWRVVAAATERTALGAVAAATERAALESSGSGNRTSCTGNSGSGNRTSCTGEQWLRQQNELHWEQWQQRQNELHWKAVAAAT
ncbi:hypothetical protein PR048_026981 [Dryococelus australis]|uniref:Zinc finger MYM-type protein 1 n=1 Tax=Dryococelus australis TaxID=614101 RepID=A0ABQ9GMV4_9NEOP|nr:hypothetical protein PR048_026981 [Dryococelus australis]